MWLTLIAMMVSFSEDKPLDVESARALVQAKLKQLGIASAPVQHLENGEVKSVLAGTQVFLLRYPRFPVARIPPAPLSSNNLFFVSPSGTVDIVSDAGQLRGWFQKHVHADTEKAAAQAVRAWLILAGELRQDGFYQFRLVNESVRVAKTAQGLSANGRLEVVAKSWQRRLSRSRIAVRSQGPARPGTRRCAIETGNTTHLSGDEAARSRSDCSAHGRTGFTDPRPACETLFGRTTATGRPGSTSSH